MKIKKIISLIMVFAVSVLCYMVAENSSVQVDAATVNSGDLWNLSGNTELSKDGDYTKLTFENGNSCEFKNTLDLSIFNMVFKFSAETIAEFKIELTSPAQEGSEESDSVNTITFNFDGTDFTAQLNDNDAVTLTDASDDELALIYENSEFKINSQSLGEMNKVGEYNATLDLINGEDEIDLLIASLNGQKLKLDEDSNIFIDETDFIDQKPTIVINKGFEDGFYIPKGFQYEVDYDAYDVLNSTVTKKIEYKKQGEDDSAYKVAENDTIVIISVTDDVNGDTYDVKFTATDKNGNEQILDTKTFKLKTDSTAPEVVAGYDYEAFNTKINDKLYVDGTEDFVAIGSGRYFYIPSFVGMFDDDVTSFSELKFDLEYSTPTSSERSLTNVSESSLKIEMTSEGRYTFRIKAIDQLGNESEFSQWFEFEIYNTSGPEVTAPTTNDNGYVDTKYTSNSFTVKGISPVTEYSLYYRADDSKEWAEAEEILDGLSFTPEKLGQYKIVCIAKDSTLRESSAETIIVVNEKTTTIKNTTDWAKNNILSIIFLCTGTLSLIGIIVLLLIKPKEEKIEVVDKEETAKTKTKIKTKSKSKK